MKSIQSGKQHKNQAVWIVLFLAIININCGKTKAVSDDLIGVWKASNIQYRDTSFEIEKKAITFRTKEGDSDSYAIVKTKKESMQDKQWVLYTIIYEDHDLQKVEFPFYFQSIDKGIIRFKNQPGLIWKNERSMTKDPHDKNTESFLFVCYGNACRSPMAEGLAKMLLGENARIESAGLAPRMKGATQLAIGVLLDMYRIDISRHSARDVADIQMDFFEHVIVLDAQVFEALKARYPLISDRFTLWDIEDPYGQGKQAIGRAAEIIKKMIERHLLSQNSK